MGQIKTGIIWRTMMTWLERLVWTAEGAEGSRELPRQLLCLVGPR